MDRTNPTAEINRRRLLLGLAAASTLVAGSAVAVASDIASAEIENPTLLALADELERAKAQFGAEVERKRAARAHYEAIAPTVPDALVVTRDVPQGQPHFCGERETDVEGETVCTGNLPVRSIATAHGLAIDVEDYSARTPFGREARRKLDIAKVYEAEIAAARRISNIDPAVEAYHYAARALDIVCEKIANEHCLTVHGLLIKADAIATCCAIDIEHKMRAAIMWGSKLADDVLRVGRAVL